MVAFLGFLVLVLLQQGNAGDGLNKYYHDVKKSKAKGKGKHKGIHKPYNLNCHCNCSCECPSPSIAPTLLPTSPPSLFSSSPSPSISPSPSPSPSPSHTIIRTQNPTQIPTGFPTSSQQPTTPNSTISPSTTITSYPSRHPTHFPTESTSPTSYPIRTSVPTDQSALPSSQSPSFNPTDSPTDEIPVYLYPLVMNMKGSSLGQAISFPGTELEIQCYNVSLYTLETKVEIGTANTCLTVSIDNSQRVKLILETSSFELPFGDFTSSIEPALAFTNLTMPNYVVSTGTSSVSNNNTISRGQGIYENVTGSVRVSGFLEGNFTDAALYFDYIYVVDFDNPI